MAPRRAPPQRQAALTADAGKSAPAEPVASSSLAAEQPVDAAPALRKRAPRPSRSKQSKAAAAAAAAPAPSAEPASSPKATTAPSSASRSPSKSPDSASISPALTGTSPCTSGPEYSIGAPSRVDSPSGLAAPSTSTSEAPSKASKDSSRRRVKSSEPSSVVPRPPNAWILYRSAKLRAGASSNEQEIGLPLAPMPGPSEAAAAPVESESATDESGQRRPGDLSKRLSAAWKAEPPDVRAHFYQLATQRRLEHEALYPDYKFTPRVTEKLAKSREVRAAAAAETRKRKEEELATRHKTTSVEGSAEPTSATQQEPDAARVATPPPAPAARASRAKSSGPKKKAKAKIAPRKAAAADAEASPDPASLERRSSYPSTPAEWAAPAPWVRDAPTAEPRGEASASQAAPVTLSRSGSKKKRLSVDLRGTGRRAGPYPPTSMRSPRSPAGATFETAMPSWSTTARSFEARRTVSGGAAEWRPLNAPPAGSSDEAAPSQARAAAHGSDSGLASPTPRRRARAATSAASSPHHRMHFDLGLGLPERQDRSAPSTLGAASWDLASSGLAQEPFQGWDERAEPSGNMTYSADDFDFDAAHAHAHAIGRSEELPMQIDPSLLEAEGSSSGLMSYGQTESASPELAEADPLGIFGGVGAPTYETSDGTLLNFQLPDSLDRQAAMMLLMGDHNESSDGRGGHAFMPGSSGELFALDGDHLRLAGRMQFDGVPSMHLNERQPRGPYATQPLSGGSMEGLQAPDMRAQHSGDAQRGYAGLADGRMSASQNTSGYGGAEKAGRVNVDSYDGQWRNSAASPTGLPGTASMATSNMAEPTLAPRAAQVSEFAPLVPRRPSLGANLRSYSYTSPAQASPPSLATQRWPTYSGVAPGREVQPSWQPSGAAAPVPQQQQPPPPSAPEPQHHYRHQHYSDHDQTSGYPEHDASGQGRDAFPLPNFSRPLSPQKPFGSDEPSHLDDTDMSWERAVSAVVHDAFPLSHPSDASALQDALDFGAMSVSRASNEHSSSFGGVSGMPAEPKLELNGTFSEGELLAHLEALRRRRAA